MATKRRTSSTKRKSNKPKAEDIRKYMLSMENFTVKELKRQFPNATSATITNIIWLFWNIPNAAPLFSTYVRWNIFSIIGILPILAKLFKAKYLEIWSITIKAIIVNIYAKLCPPY